MLRQIVVFIFFLALAGSASADWFFRGTPNDWGKTALSQVGTTDTYVTCQTFTGNPNPRFKIDRFGDWKESYPATDYTLADGSYQISFDAKTHGINVAQVKNCHGGGGHDAWYFRGTANGWGTTAMNQVDGGNIFCTTVDFVGQDPNPRFKIDHYGDWKENYPPQDIPVFPDCARYEICFNRASKVTDAKKLGNIPTFAVCGGPHKISLGATYSPQATTFALWSPDSANVQLSLDSKEYPMVRVPDANGLTDVYAVTVQGDQHLKHYSFRVDARITHDPYATMAEPGSNDDIVVNLALTEPVGGWVPQPPMKSREDAVIYEVHVRDFTIDPSSGVDPSKRGKFLGMVQPGTQFQGHATGIDHLKELGVTHVQILPFYDFNSCPVSEPASCYNWGYDPLNFNVPEERYSMSNNPVERIRELKTMINEFHKAGIRVVMDVVYNHVADKSATFGPITPKYFTAIDLSGTGNSIDARKPMVSRFIRDSLEYLTREYHIDGYRFDLIGVFDYEAVGNWGRYLNDRFPNAGLLLYGEPWNGFAQDPDEGKRVRLGTVGRIADAHVGVFNPKYREALKGDKNDSGEGGGYIFNQWEADLFRIKVGNQGSIRFKNDPNQPIDTWDPMFAIDPEQSINYVSAHDNLILRDKILAWAKLNNALDKQGYLKRIQEYANGIILTSQGIPFLQSGDEMLRDKQGDANSYKSPDSINAIRWNLKADNADVFNYFQQAIALRKSHPGFRLSSWDQVHNNVIGEQPRNGVLVNTINAQANGDGWQKIIVIYNSANNYEYTLPPGTWFVAMEKSDPNAGKDRPVSGKVTAEGTAVTVLHQ